jgi:signal transduction histidine kinase
VSGFAEDSVGDLWMALWDGGFLRYRGGHLEHFPPGGEVPLGLMEGLVIDREGRLWAGGYAGLCRIDRPAAEHPQFVTYGPAQGLSSTFVSSIAEGQQGDIFIATRRSVDRLEPESGRIQHYTAADGLAPSEPSLLFCDRHGALWVITKAGVSQLVPQAGPRPSAPSVLITGLRVRGLWFPISARGEVSIAELELKPSENQLAVDFVSPSFAAGEALRYQYMLAGADRDWSAPTDQRTVNYASLSPGSYRFLVRAVSADGLASPNPAIVTFRILLPIWLRWWFLALAAMLAGLAGYTLYRHRLGHVLELERVRTRIATDLHDDIGTSLSGMAFLSEAVKQQIGDSHSQASEMAGEVAATARGLADALGDVVWSIDPRRGDLGNLIMHVRWFASRVLEAQGIAWRFQAPPEPEKVKLAPEQRRHLLLIFKEAINNIARHSGCASVTLAIGMAGHRLEAEIEDDGRGFDPRPGPEPHDAPAGGNGLGNMRLRAAQLGGHLDIESAAGRGTRLKLTAPLK